MKLLVTATRNEAPYICEWIAYHRIIGFDHFLVYTNNNTDESLVILKALSDAGIITYFENILSVGESPQKTAFTKATRWIHEKQPDWIMTLDPDEYFFPKKTNNLDEFLASCEQASGQSIDAIAINWRIFGSSGLQYKGLGFTMERFLQASKSGYPENRIFKTLFKYNENLTGMGPHRPFYRKGVVEGLCYIDADGTSLGMETRQMGGFDKATITHANAQINHYTIRSMAEFRAKRQRGNGMAPVDFSVSSRDTSYLRRFDRNDEYENDILRFIQLTTKEYFELISECSLQSLMFNLGRNISL